MRTKSRAIGWTVLAGLLLLAPAVAAEDDAERDFEGSLEVLVRNVNQNGSLAKYDEDFDGLDSGARLSNLALRWNRFDVKAIDFLTLEATGLGGDPYERTSFRMGRKDTYDLAVKHSAQTYLYDLFGLTGDQDGSRWDTQRSLTEVDLTLHATDTIDLFFEYDEVQRDGTSLVMKDINTDLFRLQTPLDQSAKRYAVGGKFRLGSVDLFFRQQLRRNDYRFDNTTSGNVGLSSTDLATLTDYEWIQRDTSNADLTTLTISAPLGERVDLTVTALGTLLGEEETESRVSLNAEGTSFRGTCSVTGAVCTTASPCDSGVPGNVCVADPFSVTDGTSSADLETDHFRLDADLSVACHETLDFHLQFRRVDREVTGVHLRDLDGNGAADDTEGTVNDSTPGSDTTVDYSLSSVTGLFDYAPSSIVRLSAGYRTVNRDLERSGFEFGTTEYRNTDFESDGDETILLGVQLRPVGWFRLNADYEEGDIDQAFTAVAPMETDRLRVRASFQPRSGMRLELAFLDYERTNDGFDFRDVADCSVAGADIDDGCRSSRMDGSTYSASFSHRANDNLDYWFRWAQQDVESKVRIRFDTDAFFNSAENGDSTYDNTSTEWAGQVSFSWSEPWRAWIRGRINDSDGDNDILGTVFANNLIIDQDYVDVEGGLTYTFSSGLHIGGRYRTFDYDDGNDLLDYDGEVFTIVAGLTF